MHKLEYYQKKFNASKIPQGSSDWFEGRQYCFGGSEMAGILGQNKYMKEESIIASKKPGAIPFVSDYTQWGLMFEPVAKVFISKERGTIHEFGSVPHCQYPVCYSPDGILVEGDHLVLLEIKSPIMRGVGSIPEHYFPQVYTGMSVFHVHHTLFVQCRFRRCKYGTNPTNATFDRPYHKEYYKRCKDKLPISWGYLWWDVPGDLQDLALLSEMHSTINNTKVQPSIHVEALDFQPDHGKILQWKLFEISYSIVLPKPNYLDSMADKLWDKYKEMRKTANCSSQENKAVTEVEEQKV